MPQQQKKTIGEFYERIDFSNDPNIFLFYKHILTGLTSFANPQQTAEESFAKYKVMLRIAEGFISEKFNVDFNEVRKQIAEETDDDSERLSKEVMYIAKLLDSSVRKVEIQLVWNKRAKDDDNDESALLEISGYEPEAEDDDNTETKSDTTQSI